MDTDKMIYDSYAASPKLISADPEPPKCVKTLRAMLLYDLEALISQLELADDWSHVPDPRLFFVRFAPEFYQELGVEVQTVSLEQLVADLREIHQWLMSAENGFFIRQYAEGSLVYVATKAMKLIKGNKLISATDGPAAG